MKTKLTFTNVDWNEIIWGFIKGQYPYLKGMRNVRLDEDGEGLVVNKNGSYEIYETGRGGTTYTTFYDKDRYYLREESSDFYNYESETFSFSNLLQSIYNFFIGEYKLKTMYQVNFLET